MVQTSVQVSGGKPVLSEKAQRLLAAHDREVRLRQQDTKGE